MPQNLTNEKSTLIKVMAWCRHMASLGHNGLRVKQDAQNLNDNLLLKAD